MRQPAHSEKTLETLRQMQCPLTGWALPPLEWQTVRMAVPTRVRCETCRGSGQVADADARARAAQATTAAQRSHLEHAMRRCPDCPPRRLWPNHGSGEVTKPVEREVEVATIRWPDATRFDSRFAGGGRCELCAKAITHFVPVLGHDTAGRPHGMWVGEDCARTLLGVALQGTPIEVAIDTARARKAAARAERTLWRERPKAAAPAAPPKPKLVNPATQAELDALVRTAFGDHADPRTSYHVSKAELSYHFVLRRANGAGRGYEVKVSARYGVTVRSDFETPFLKDRDRQSAIDALRDALPAIQHDFREWRASDG